MPTHWRKPRVALVHSATTSSEASTNLAHYFGGCLALAGYSDVKLIRFDAKPGARPPEKKALMIIPPGEKAPNVPNARDLFFTAALDEVKDCQVVVVCVDAPDTAACGKQLAKLLSAKRDDRTGVFCLQHGCKTFAELKGHLGEAPVILVDGAVGIHVVKSAADGSLGLLAPGSLVLTRLAKDDADEGLKYIDLLQSSGIPMIFRKIMTPFTWGSLVAYPCDATNALTGDTLQEHLGDWRARRVCAAMIRESCAALSKAARNGGWVPDTSATFAGLSAKRLELVLCLPSFLFVPLSRWLLPVTPGARSCAQLDLRERYKTSLDWTLGELVEVGKKYEVPMPVSTHIQGMVRDAAAKGDGVPMVAIEQIFDSVGPQTREGPRELGRLGMKIALAAGTIILAISLLDVIAPSSPM